MGGRELAWSGRIAGGGGSRAGEQGELVMAGPQVHARLLEGAQKSGRRL